MASSRVDKLSKVIAQLDASLETHDSTSKKHQSNEKLRVLCTEVKDMIVSNDFTSIHKEDNRYAEQVNKAIQTIFRIVNHPDQNTRTFAEEVLDSVLRSLLLGFHQYRVLVCLISEISRNGSARSLVSAYSRLASLVHLSKTNRIISYGVHIANALSAMLKRPEEAVQQAILQHTPAIFNAIGPRMRDQQTEKLFAVYQVAAENLEVAGTTNRAAVVVISQICQYYSSILQKAFVRCYTNVRMPNELECKNRLVGSLNTLKNIWPIVQKNNKVVQEDMLKMCLASICCCLYSTQSEVVVSSLELLQVVFDNPVKLMDTFDPTDFSAMLVWKPLLSADRLSLSSSKLESDAASLKSVSTLDISNTDGDSDRPFNEPLVFSDSPIYQDNSSDSDMTETGGEEEIIDPLMHADLYEEANRPDTPPSTMDACDPATPGKMSKIPMQPPSDVCCEGANFFLYTTATLGKVFLLAGLKGLKNDRDVRISHKMLALNCLVSIANKKDICDAVVLFDDGQQPLNEAIRFVLHEDDQLCASAIQFMAALDRWKPIYREHYIKVAASFQVIRKRALLQAFVGKQDLMLTLNLVEPILDHAKSQAMSSYFLIQITCAEFLASIQWNKLDSSLKRKHQRSCLRSYFDLLFASDPKVSRTAVENFPRLVRNADFTKYSSAFATTLPSEPLMNTGLIPAVLNLSKEFNFFNESSDYVLESNLEVVLYELNVYYSEDSEARSFAYCNSLETLMEAFPPTIYYEVWGAVSKSTSITPQILTSILDKCEASLCSASSLTVGLNVISKLFAGMCEGYMVQVVREQTTLDRKALPKLPEPQVLDRILLLALRSINMYYSLIAEHRSTLSQASTSLLNRSTMSPLSTKKPSPNRIADISHLMGTSVHPSRKSSYLESLTLNSIYPSVQGAYTNYLGSLSKELEQKFTGLLQAAMNCLGCVCEMLSFAQLKPVIEEILLYIKVVLEVVPIPASSLLHQMFKVVFGKNAANINLNCLNASKMKDPLPPRSREEIYYLRYANEFTMFASLISRKDYISSYIHRELGWLKSDMLSKIHVPSSAEISTALEPFEGFVTQLRHIYNAYQSIDFKKNVLGVMCELPRNGIIYNMADPKKILLDLVIQQTQDPSFGNMEILTEIVLFLVVLARTSVLKFEHIVKIGSDLLEKTNENNAKHVLECVRVIILELLYVQQVELDILYTSFNIRSKDLFHYAPDKTLYIWMLILHMTDKTSQKSISIDFFGNFSEYMISDDPSYGCSFTLSCATLSMMSPSMFLPVDNFFKYLQRFIEEECEMSKYWGRITVILFILLHAVEEDPMLLRLEDLVQEPLNWLTRTIVELINKGLQELRNPDFNVNIFVHFLQTLISVFKAGRYKLLNVSIGFALKDATFERCLLKINWTVYSQILQLYRLTPEAAATIREIGPVCNDSHLTRLYQLFASDRSKATDGLEKRTSKQIAINPVLLSQGLPEEIVLAVFKESTWDERKDIYTSVLKMSSASLYPLINTMTPSKKKQFLDNVLDEMIEQLTITKEKEQRKVLEATCQEFLDMVEEHIRIGKDSSCEQIWISLAVLSKVAHLYQVCPTLQLTEFSQEQIFSYLHFATANISNKKVAEGLQFVLGSKSAQQFYSSHPLSLLENIAEFLGHIVKAYTKEQPKMWSRGESFTVNCRSSEVTLLFGSKLAEELIGELFDSTQHIILHLQSGLHSMPSSVVSLLRVFFRHPVLHSLAIAPLAALKMQWNLRVDIKNSPHSVHVPLVNIHMLCNIDVLHDFSWRINWIGWTSRQQFEDFWMSLFGVLSSTPTGAEIADNANVTEQILASSLAVSTLCDILLYTLLFPEPGNVPSGVFVVKDREKNELFYESKAMSQLQGLLGRLRGKNPDVLFTKNIERFQDAGEVYDLGQLCAMSLWTLTGDLRSTKKDSPERLKISLSEYLLKTTSELDTASSVRALFENFSHWFSRGLEFLPLPLLSATVRAMVFLSDLFDETQSYEFLYNQVKVVYRGGFLADHSDLGYVIYALLKAVTVIGVDSVERTMTEADVAKLILSWVELGLTSSYPFVRSATLHGVLYILQSMATESLKVVYQYVASFLHAELTDIVMRTGSRAISDNSYGYAYERLLWTVSFRLMEEPMQVNFRNNLNKLIVASYQTVPSNSKTLEVVTAGVEELILHSASYVAQYLDVFSQILKEYSTMGHAFHFALRIFTVCIFREEMDPKRILAKKFVAPLEELLGLYRRVDHRDAHRIAKVLVPILLRLQTEEQAFTTIFDLLSGSSLYCNEKATLSMIYEFFQRLRDARRMSCLQEFSRYAVNTSKILYEDKKEYLASAVLFATSPKVEIAERFHFVLCVPHETLETASFNQLLASCHDIH